MDKVQRPGTLGAAFKRVKANRGSTGVDHQTIEMFERDLEGTLERLQQELKEGSYRPQATFLSARSQNRNSTDVSMFFGRHDAVTRPFYLHLRPAKRTRLKLVSI